MPDFNVDMKQSAMAFWEGLPVFG